MRHFRLETRTTSSLATGNVVGGLLHGRRSPYALVPPDPFPSNTGSNKLRKRAVQRQHTARKRRTSYPQHDAPPPSSPSNSPAFGRRKRRGSKAWTKLYHRHIEATKYDDPSVPISEIAFSCGEAIQREHDEFVELDNDWNEHRNLHHAFLDKHIDHHQTLLDEQLKQFWNESAALDSQEKDLDVISIQSASSSSFRRNFLSEVASFQHDTCAGTTATELGANAPTNSSGESHSNTADSFHFSARDDDDDSTHELSISSIDPIDDKEFNAINEFVDNHIIPIR